MLYDFSNPAFVKQSRTCMNILICLVGFMLAKPVIATAQESLWIKSFKNPPGKYRPVPLWFINGKLTKEETGKQLKDAYKSGFGGVSPLPLSVGFNLFDKNKYEGMEPAYFSKEYFEIYGDILRKEKQLGMHHILYDDMNFPSGVAGGKMRELYPDDTRKILYKKDTIINAGETIRLVIPNGRLMAVVAMDTFTKKRVDLIAHIKENQLNFTAPNGVWKVMIFTANVHHSEKEAGYMDVVDYLDPKAINKFIGLAYEPYAQHFKNFFGNTISQIFYDDVGFFTGTDEGQRTWAYGFNEKFKVLYGKDPSLYYPALWENIGAETDAARTALFNTRAELLAEGWPRSINEWTRKNNLKASGHPPDNYNPQPVHMSGDIFKFYRHEEIPTMDLIFEYGRGRDGFKLISSAATQYDRPVVAAEIYGAIGLIGPHKLDKNMLYRAAMELFARGINFLIPHAMWYDYDSASIRIPPLISSYDAVVGAELPQYNEWAARNSMLLQGGKTVTDIAILYPIASLEAWYEFGHFNGMSSPDWSTTAPGTDYLAVGDILSNQLHRDFTFIHPDAFAANKIIIRNKSLLLNNKIDKQSYTTLIVPGGKVIALSALKKVKEFYDQGGKVIATSVLPSKSAEFGKDEEVVSIIKEMFGIDPTKPMPVSGSLIRSNTKGGQLIFIPAPDTKNMTETFSKMNVVADVVFENNPMPNSANGCLNYIHKSKDGKEVYFFSNSTDDNINTHVELRGKIKPALWNPYDGSVSAISDVQYIQKNGKLYTKIPLTLNAVQSVFVIGEK